MKWRARVQAHCTHEIETTPSWWWSLIAKVISVIVTFCTPATYLWNEIKIQDRLRLCGTFWVLCVIKWREEESRGGWTAAYENKLKTAELGKGHALCTCKCGRREQADPGSEANEIRDLSARDAACIKFGLFSPLSVVWSEESKSSAVTVMLQSRTQKDGWQWLRRTGGRGEGALAAYWTTDGWGVEVNTSAPNHTTDLFRPQ